MNHVDETSVYSFDCTRNGVHDTKKPPSAVTGSIWFARQIMLRMAQRNLSVWSLRVIYQWPKNGMSMNTKFSFARMMMIPAHEEESV